MSIPKFLRREEDPLPPAVELALHDLAQTAEHNVARRRVDYHPDDYGERRSAQPQPIERREPVALAASGLLTHYEQLATRFEEAAAALRDATEALTRDVEARIASLRQDADLTCRGLDRIAGVTRNKAEEFRADFEAAQATQRAHINAAQALIDQVGGITPPTPALPPAAALQGGEEFLRQSRENNDTVTGRVDGYYEETQQ